ncbi:MAG: hypothetical protein CFE29_06700 [Bradyrhizobiaceae bacterium PARB1]|jgi:hypothetical protein|nr:MAG: hypothetical protein CFE29_06700 [Bradyrhizobiaceae bacterium PARB1]
MQFSSTPAYAVGAYGGRTAIEWWGRYILMDPHDLSVGQVGTPIRLSKRAAKDREPMDRMMQMFDDLSIAQETLEFLLLYWRINEPNRRQELFELAIRKSPDIRHKEANDNPHD